jgi:hypothetical protein
MVCGCNLGQGHNVIAVRARAPASCVAICTPVMAATDSSLRAVSDLENRMPNALDLGTSRKLGTGASQPLNTPAQLNKGPAPWKPNILHRHKIRLCPISRVFAAIRPSPTLALSPDRSEGVQLAIHV